MADPQNTPTESKPVWGGLARQIRTARGTVRIVPRWGLIAGLAGAALVAFIFLVFTLVFFLYKNRGYENFTYYDAMTFLWRREALRERQGDYQIEVARNLVDEGRFREGLTMLTTGVSRSPENVEGRLLLARIYSAIRPERALDIVREGIEYGQNNDEYLQLYLFLLFQENLDEETLNFAREFLPAEPVISKRHLLVAFAAAQAATRQGDMSYVKELSNRYFLTGTVDGILLASTIFERMGHPEEGRAVLEQFIRSHRGNPDIDQVLERLIRLIQQSGDQNLALRLSLDRVLRQPNAWRPRVDLVRTYWESGQKERAAQEAATAIRLFSAEPAALYRLGQQSANLGDVATATRLYETALEQNLDLAAFALLLIETHVTARNYNQAIALANELQAEQPAWLLTSQSVFAGLRALAYYGAGNNEMGQLYLNELANGGPMEPELLRRLAQVFKDNGFPEQALHLLREATRRDERDESALARLVEVELELGESRSLAENVDRLLGLAHPEAAFLQRLRADLGSDRFLFTPGRRSLLNRLDVLLEKARTFEWQPSLAPPPAPTPDVALAR